MKARAVFEEFLSRKAREHGPRFDPSDLHPQFVPYFESGERVRVATLGEELTGTIGVTTGWKPGFLLMRRKSDTGSVYVLRAEDRVLAVQRGRKYEEVTA
jgi:hypothetical protein